MHEKLDIPDNALLELSRYLVARKSISLETGIKEEAISYAASNGYSALDGEQKKQYERFICQLNSVNEISLLPASLLEKAVLKALENLTYVENKEKYLGMLQAITDIEKFYNENLSAASIFLIAYDIINSSDRFRHDADSLLKLFRSAKDAAVSLNKLYEGILKSDIAALCGLNTDKEINDMLELLYNSRYVNLKKEFAPEKKEKSFCTLTEEEIEEIVNSTKGSPINRPIEKIKIKEFDELMAELDELLKQVC